MMNFPPNPPDRETEENETEENENESPDKTLGAG